MVCVCVGGVCVGGVCVECGWSAASNYYYIIQFITYFVFYLSKISLAWTLETPDILIV